MIPRGGGFRILGIRELFVKNQAFELFSQVANFARILSSFEAAQQGCESFVRGVALNPCALGSGRESL